MRAAHFLALGLLLASCQSSDSGGGASGGPIQRIEINGRQSFDGGVPLQTSEVSYRLSVNGDDLFRRQGGSCTEMPEHGSGLYLGSAASRADSAFSFAVSTGSIHAAVVPSCALASLSTEQVQGLRLTASIPASQAACQAYCTASQPSDPGCVDDCTSGSRLIQAVRPVSPKELSALLAGVKDGVLRWDADLVFSTLGPPLSDGDGVDLQVSAASAAISAHITREMFTADSCETNSSCIRGTGLRTLLRFDTVIENVGTSDLVLGDPAHNPLFEYHACHQHYHLKDVLLYELAYPATGEVVTASGQGVVGEKTSFCMMDMDPVSADAPSRGFDCDNQGISAGWSDEYDSSLECQFLDVTGVPPGQYLLRMTVNPDNILDESDTTNNVTEVPVNIS